MVWPCPLRPSVVLQLTETRNRPSLRQRSTDVGVQPVPVAALTVIVFEYSLSFSFDSATSLSGSAVIFSVWMPAGSDPIEKSSKYP